MQNATIPLSQLKLPLPRHVDQPLSRLFCFGCHLHKEQRERERNREIGRGNEGQHRNRSVDRPTTDHSPTRSHLLVLLLSTLITE